MHTTLFPFPGPTGTSEFAMAFTSTPRGARLARLFVAHCLDAWGHPYDSDVNETLTLITAELCAEADGKQLRLEVSDDWDERRPTVVPPAAPGAESGRGLLLVTALADDWASPTTVAAPGKTVWASVRTPQPLPGEHVERPAPSSRSSRGQPRPWYR